MARACIAFLSCAVDSLRADLGAKCSFVASHILHILPQDLAHVHFNALLLITQKSRLIKGFVIPGFSSIRTRELGISSLRTVFPKVCSVGCRILIGLRG